MNRLIPVFLCAASVAAQEVTHSQKTPSLPQVGDFKTWSQQPGKLPVADPAPALPSEVPVWSADKSMSKPAFHPPGNQLFLDSPSQGEHWARGANYKAGLDADGIRFYAAPEDLNDAPPRLGLRLQQVTVAGETVQLVGGIPVRDEARVEWHRGGCVERVDLAVGGIEQSFHFKDLPARGEVVVKIAVEGGPPQHTADGMLFAGGAIRYGNAIALDARGRSIAVPSNYCDGAIEIRVPAEFVSSAELPLVIDPWVLSNTIVNSTNQDVSNADVVWSPTDGTWMVAYESRFGAGDTDVYIVRLNAQMQPVSLPEPVDLTNLVWQLPAIANLRVYQRNLIVAQVSVDDVAPFWIGGRVHGENGSATTAQFDIDRAGTTGHASGDKLRPDVGGDPSLFGPTYFTVVWQRVFSATDHDIHMKQVRWDGTLRAAGVTALANTTANQSRPSISKSNGAPGPNGAAAPQRWMVVWQQTYNSTDEDIHGCLLTYDGQIVTVNGNNSFIINNQAALDQRPKVSSPIAAISGREVLVVFERQGGGNQQVVATRVLTNGSVLGQTNLSTLTSQLPSTWHQGRPSVDTDGVRYAVSFDYLFASSLIDLDLRTVLLARSGPGLVIHDEVSIASSTLPEFAASIASVYSSTGAHDLRYAIVNDLAISSPFRIQAHAYAGYGVGVFATRNTSCGSLGITPTGTPSVSQPSTYQLDTVYPLSGFLVGWPQSSVTPACPGCVLGVDGDSILGTSYTLTLPANAAFAGITLAVQGWTFAGGPCLGSVSLSDTVDLTIF